MDIKDCYKHIRLLAIEIVGPYGLQVTLISCSNFFSNFPKLVSPFCYYYYNKRFYFSLASNVNFFEIFYCLIKPVSDLFFISG